MLVRFILFCFLLFPLSGASQQYDIEEDSMLYEDYYVDTTKSIHIGIEVGGNVQSLFYSINSDYEHSDSILFNGSTPSIGYTIGLSFAKDISDKLWLKSGIYISISKLNIKYDYQNSNNNYSFNHSTLEVPFYLQYSFKNRREGLSWGTGFKASIDITRDEDIEARLFKLNTFDLLLGTGPNYRWKLISGNSVDLSIMLNVGLINIIGENSSIYNQSLNAGHRWQLLFLLGFN